MVVRRDGGPAPLLQNPSVGLSALLMVISVLVFFMSVFGCVSASLLKNTCAQVPLWYYMVLVGFEAMLSSVFYSVLSFVRWASDTWWAKMAGLGLFINLGQIGTFVWGFLLLREATKDNDCWETGPVTISMTMACSFIFIVEVAIAFLTVYFVYIPTLTHDRTKYVKFY